jgi:hypothetical protein
LGEDAQRDFTPLDPEEYTSFLEDPVKFGQNALQGKDQSRLWGGLGTLVAGPAGMLAGAAVAGGMAATNVAQAKAASEIAKARGFDTTALDEKISSYIAGLPNASRFAASLASGEKFAERFLDTARDMSLPESTYGKNPLSRDFFASGAAGDAAFRREMETTAPPGMVYDPNR